MREGRKEVKRKGRREGEREGRKIRKEGRKREVGEAARASVPVCTGLKIMYFPFAEASVRF